MRASVIVVLFAITASLSFTQCTKKEETPIGVIDKDTLVNVLYDIHLTNGISNNRHDLSLKYKNLNPDLYRAVLNKYNIADTTLENSLKYYMINIEQLESIYDKVINKFQIEQDILNPPVIEPDSLSVDIKTDSIKDLKRSNKRDIKSKE